MPIVGAFVTIAIQVGAAYLNYTTNKKTVAKIKSMQRENRKADLEHGYKRNYERFRASCDFQYQMEVTGHQQRMNDINDDFINAFELTAHAYAMSNYPLMISPYFISKSVIAKCGTELDNFRQELLCILTNSNDVNFNALIYPEIDMRLNESISEYWNHKSLHTVCYYPEIWNSAHLYSDEKILNLQASIKTPTITITPYFEKDNDRANIVIKVNFWNRTDENNNGSRLTFSVPTGIEIAKSINQYTDDERNELVSELFNFIICILGVQADLHYWATSYQPPLLPSLISKDKIECGDLIKNECMNSYVDSFRKLILGQVDTDNTEMSIVRDLAEINLYNHPERSIEFINSIINLTQDKDVTLDLIFETIYSIYKIRTGNSVSNIEELNVKYLGIDDIKIFNDLVIILRKCDFLNESNLVAEIIKKRIMAYVIE